MKFFSYVNKTRETMCFSYGHLNDDGDKMSDKP